MTTRTAHPAPGSPRSAGFTLIEMTLAVALLVIISLTVYRFTDAALRATDVSMQLSAEDTACGGLRRLLATQLSSLPASQSGVLTGVEITRKGTRHDVLQMVCPAGNAVLTPDAKGYYQVTLVLDEIPRNSGHWSLVMERTPWDDDDDDDDDALKPDAPSLRTARQQLPSDHVTLLDNVNALELAYFDRRLNGWMDKWTDQANLPNLVRMRVSLAGNAVPYEIIERVPGGGLAKVIPTNVNQPTVTPFPGQNVNNGSQSQ